MVHGNEIQVSLGPGQSIDDALLNGAILGLSAEEISARIGGILSPARVMVKTREMLSAGDWLEDVERERAVLRLLEKNLLALDQNALKDADSYRVILAYAKELFARIDKRKAANDADMNRLYQAQARIMAQAINLAFEKALFELRKRYPDIEESDVRAVLSESIPEAVVVLTAHNAGEAIAA